MRSITCEQCCNLRKGSESLFFTPAFRNRRAFNRHLKKHLTTDVSLLRRTRAEDPNRSMPRPIPEEAEDELYESYDHFLLRTSTFNNNANSYLETKVRGFGGLDLIDIGKDSLSLEQGNLLIDGFMYKLDREELFIVKEQSDDKENCISISRVRNDLHSIDALEEEVEEINFDGTSKINDEVYNTEQSDCSSLNEDLSIASDEFMNNDSGEMEDSPGEMSFLDTSFDLNLSVTSSDVENYEKSGHGNGDKQRRASLNLSNLLNEADEESESSQASVTMNEKSGVIGGSVDEILARYQKHINIVKKSDSPAPSKPNEKIFNLIDQSQKQTLPLPLRENLSNVIVRNNSSKDTQTKATGKATLPLPPKQTISTLEKMNVGTTVTVVKRQANPKDAPIKPRNQHPLSSPRPNQKLNLSSTPNPVADQQRKIKKKGSGSFKCDVCEKAYASNHLLLKHKTLHTGGKVHQCKKCSESFDKFSELRAHLKTHA